MARAGDLRCENRQLHAEIARLRATLAGLGVDPGEIAPPWTSRLTPTQAAVVGVLLDRHPRSVDAYTLEELTRVSDHARERGVGVINVLVLQIRKRLDLGRDAIVAVRGRGFALSEAAAAALRAEAGA